MKIYLDTSLILTPKKLYLVTFFNILFVILCVSQTVEINKEKALLLNEFDYWCSEEAAFSTTELEYPQPLGTCYEKSLRYAKWFKLKAETPNLEVILKIGGSEGSLRFPYIHIWDELLNPVICKSYDDEDDDMTLTTKSLTEGKWYYIAINNHNKDEYKGTFTLCLNNQISNDFKEGAIELQETSKWCSSEGGFTTKDASADQKKASCLSTGPNFNRWFKFKAKTKQINIEIQTDGAKGTSQFPYIALFDEQMTELSCSRYKDEQTPIIVSSSNLTQGKWYYISVDHQYNIKYLGTFTLCVDDYTLEEKDFVEITGKMSDANYAPISSLKMELLNEEEKVLTSSLTDSKGKFVFKDLAAGRAYFVRAGMDMQNTKAAIFIVDNNGKAIKKTVRKQSDLFAFMNLPSNCGLITLVDCDDIKLKVDAKKTGVVGKIVNRNQLTDGIPGIKVYLYNTPEKATDSTDTDKNGLFQFVNLPPDRSPLIKIAGNADELYAEMLVINDQEQAIKSATSDQIDGSGFFKFELLPAIKIDPLGQIVAEDEKLNIELTEALINSDKALTLKNIYFDEGKYELLSTSFKELDVLYVLLKNNPKTSIIIYGYTDNTGSLQTNKKLSLLRAKAVADYLMAKNISQKRITYKGYGGSNPVADNATEKGRQANRRVEIKVSDKK